VYTNACDSYDTDNLKATTQSCLDNVATTTWYETMIDSHISFLYWFLIASAPGKQCYRCDTDEPFCHWETYVPIATRDPTLSWWSCVKSSTTPDIYYASTLTSNLSAPAPAQATVQKEKNGSSFSTGTIIGTAFGGIAFLILMFAIVAYICLMKKRSRDKDAMVAVDAKQVNNSENGLTFPSPDFSSAHASYMSNGTYVPNGPYVSNGMNQVPYPVYVYPQELAVPDQDTAPAQWYSTKSMDVGNYSVSELAGHTPVHGSPLQLNRVSPLAAIASYSPSDIGTSVHQRNISDPTSFESTIVAQSPDLQNVQEHASQAPIQETQGDSRYLSQVQHQRGDQQHSNNVQSVQYPAPP
jgi:hypothetical protein